ncbi:DUF3192 domain-containing protein [Thalassotalea sp. LPB0316]|uniref:DUF3192 domain-containing protein n=1 Tax=Thalassotalea sp. LPB0316 TaxID=2769490 RepID=UPI0018678034|nr:DUF3192 domain-containing protein [Thalassotalea sp. LPB0316]QOL24541.1 DUF3192 domain-containing protein [Thalassotalea sp. LPB0316]
MKKSLLTIALVAPLVLGLSACSINIGGEDSYHSSKHGEEYNNRQQIANLRVDTPYVEVVNRMGVAAFNETYEKNGETIQVLYYRTQRKHSDGMTTKDECTPLIFKGGLLKSWGDMALTQI